MKNTFKIVFFNQVYYCNFITILIYEICVFKFLACFISLISQINKSVIQDDKCMAYKPIYNQHNQYSFYVFPFSYIYIYMNVP